ncbi:MAG TPA: alpha-N-arabinofuranosidase, partial [Segatella copri]|nr:alpha-N-arabinofuranosidase [Segatella copri]
KTSKGKRYVQASNDFRTFKEDTLEASADEILWQRDTATIDGKLFQGCDFEVPAVHLNYIRSWFHALSEEAKLNAQPIPKTDSDLAAYACRKIRKSLPTSVSIHRNPTASPTS